MTLKNIFLSPTKMNNKSMIQSVVSLTLCSLWSFFANSTNLLTFSAHFTDMNLHTSFFLLYYIPWLLNFPYATFLSSPTEILTSPWNAGAPLVPSLIPGCSMVRQREKVVTHSWLQSHFYHWHTRLPNFLDFQVLQLWKMDYRMMLIVLEETKQDIRA